MIQAAKRAKRQIFAIIGVFLFLGIFYILITPKTFRAEAILLPEPKNSSSPAGGLSQLASSLPGLGSINLGSSGAEAIRPEFYPSIVQSTPFLREFVAYTFYHSEFADSVNFRTYGQKYAPINPISILKKYTLGLPGMALTALRGESPSPGSGQAEPVNSSGESFYRPSVGDHLYLKDIKDLVNVSIDNKTGMIKVAVQSTDPIVSAYLTEFTKQYLIEYVTRYRQEKQLQQTNFLELKVKELEADFLDDQAKLAAFKERNYNISSAFLQNQLENLTSKYELSRNLYFSMATQLDQALIKLNEETPIFAEIEPVSIPAVKSKPQTMLILFLMGSLGILASALFVLVQSSKQE